MDIKNWIWCGSFRDTNMLQGSWRKGPAQNISRISPTPGKAPGGIGERMTTSLKISLWARLL
ncbi:hypothetical protein DsansV1_C06g0062171 [Dioscorea sansibarensis]